MHMVTCSGIASIEQVLILSGRQAFVWQVLAIGRVLVGQVVRLGCRPPFSGRMT
jgi:hypothetical protein